MENNYGTENKTNRDIQRAEKIANYRIQQMCDKIAKDAFNEGRQRVIENASKLNWEDVMIYGQHGMYLNVCRVHKPLGDFLIRQRFQPKDIELFFLDEYIRGEFKSVNEAKEYAKEMYENEIKKVLGV